MISCKLCERNQAEPNGICATCMDALGIIEMPPPRRRPAPCTKCGGLQFVRVIPREQTVKHGYESNVPDIAPMTLTQTPAVGDRLLGQGKTVAHPGPVLGEGMLETYTCLKCGFVEWYVEDPTEIPIGPEYMSELVDYSSEPPYR